MPAIAVDNTASTPLVEPVAPLRSGSARSDGPNSFDDHLQRVTSPASGSATTQSNSPRQNNDSSSDRKEHPPQFTTASGAIAASNASNDATSQQSSATVLDEKAPQTEKSKPTDAITAKADRAAKDGKHHDHKHNVNSDGNGNTSAASAAAAAGLAAKPVAKPGIEKGEGATAKEESAEAVGKLTDEKPAKSKLATTATRIGGKPATAITSTTKSTAIQAAANAQETAETTNASAEDAEQQAAAAAKLAEEQAASQDAAKLEGSAAIRPATDGKPKQATPSKDKATPAVAKNAPAKHVAEKTDTSVPADEHASASDTSEPKTKQGNRPRTTSVAASDAKPSAEAVAAKAADAPPTINTQLPLRVTAPIVTEVASTAKPVEANVIVDAASATTTANQTQPTPAATPTQNAPTTISNPAPAPVLSTVGSKRAAATATNSTNLNEVDRARFVQRVARAMQTADDRGGEIRLRLSPPELGSLKLEVSVRDGVMNAHVEAETTTARSLLVDNLPALREKLAEQNIKIDRFDVDVQSGSSGSLPDRSAGDADANARRGAASGRNSGVQADAATDVTKTPATTYRVFRDGHLNVIV